MSGQDVMVMLTTICLIIALTEAYKTYKHNHSAKN